MVYYFINEQVFFFFTQTEREGGVKCTRRGIEYRLGNTGLYYIIIYKLRIYFIHIICVLLISTNAIQQVADVKTDPRERPKVNSAIKYHRALFNLRAPQTTRRSQLCTPRVH